MRLLLILPITILMLLGAQISVAEVVISKPSSKNSTEKKQWYHPFEIGELKIKQSNDGSGIIKEVSCGECDYQFVKITADTKVYVNGVEVNLLRARERAGQQAFIEFDKETAEVKFIHWSEAP